MSLKWIAVILTAIACVVAVKGAAKTATSLPQFEVVSIKPSGPQSPRGSRGGPGSAGPERYEFFSANLLDLILTAWNVDRFQISSKADLEREHFDVDAKVPPGTTRDDFRLMLQNMLTDRFGIQVHVEQKNFEAYGLRITKSGLKMKEAADMAAVQVAPGSNGQAGSVQNRPYLNSKMSLGGSFKVVHTEAHLQTMSMLAIRLLKPDGMPVVDETGLTGRYDYTLDYCEDLPAPSDLSAPPAPSLATALSQLGLELVKEKLPFKVIIVDSINREPTPN